MADRNMKIDRLYNRALLGMLLCAFVFQSCLKDDVEVFDKNPSERLQQYISEVKDVLTGAEEGWLFEMYPQSAQGYGGYAFIVRFDEEKVYASSELAGDNEMVVESLYKMTDDDGPVLSFDTYNLLLHYLATPSSDAYEAFEGEFEFVVLDATSDLVTLRGKKTNNIMYMRKMTEDPVSYLDKISTLEESMVLSGFSGTVGGAQVTGTIDVDYRQISFGQDGAESVTAAYVLTDEGLRLYEPVEVAGATFEEFIVDPETNSLTDKGGSGTVFNAVFPEGWRGYAAFAGNYVLSFNGGTEVNVTLAPAGDGASYIMSGLNAQFTVTLGYQRSSGSLTWLSQKIGEANGNEIWLCSWDAGPGQLTWNAAVGMRTEWNGDEQHPVYTWTDYGTWPGYSVNSYIMWQLSGGSSAGQFANSSWYIAGTRSNRLPYVEAMTKID